MLVEAGKELGFTTIIVEKEKYQDKEISSTYIREELKVGHMETVNEMCIRDSGYRNNDRNNNGGYGNRDNNGGYRNNDRNNNGGYGNRDNNGYRNNDRNNGGYRNNDRNNNGGYGNRDNNGGYRNNDRNKMCIRERD